MFHFCPEEAAALAAALPFTTYLWLWVKAHVFRIKAKPCPDHTIPSPHGGLMTLFARIQALLDESAATENLDTGVALDLLRETLVILVDHRPTGPSLEDKMTELLHGYTLVLEIKPADGTFVDAAEGHIEISEGDALVCLDICGGTDEAPVSERFFHLTLNDVVDVAYAHHPLVAPAGTT